MPSNRNKTIRVTNEDLASFADFKILTDKAQRTDLINTIFYGSALKDIEHIPDASVDLVVTDPPYNLNKNFGQGSIKMSNNEYRDWCNTWITQCARILKPTGSIYICCDWSYSGMFQELLSPLFTIRNRITWKRDKGRGAKANWKNNMEDIWYATKSDEYTFNLDNVKVKKKVIAPYVDQKGQPKDWFEEKGVKYRYTHPSNIWTDLTVPFWSMPENTEHPTQKPEKLIERLILASSNEGDLVFDPFIGSGTTAVVAKRLNRNYSGFEIDKKYYILTHKRLSTS
jgi:site-specific DNA-methyltransferase (adenine-specific)